MLRAICATAAALMLGLLAFGGTATAAPVFPPGLRIGLEPAPGLTLSHRFPGFEDPERHVAVAILDLPGAAYSGLMRSAVAKDQAGMTDVKRESFMFASGVGELVTGDAQDNGKSVHRWFLVASAAAVAVPNLTALIRVEIPEAARATYTDAVVRRMLASVTFRQVPLQEMLGMLPFKLTDMAGFRVVRVSRDGVVVADAENESAGKPYAIISVGRGAPDDPADRGRFARDLMMRSPVHDLKLTSAEAMRIKGQQGFEIRAQASGLNDVPIVLVQWLRFGGSGGFLRIIAVAQKSDFDAVFNRFRAVRDGVTFK